MNIEIFYNKIIDNYNALAEMHNIAAVLKSNAYGYNLKKVAEVILSNTDCCIFFVNTLEEGIQLHSCNKIEKNIQIFILYPLITHDIYETYWKYNFIPLIQSYQQLEEHREFFQKCEKVGLFIETGLYRIGFDYDTIKELLERDPNFFKDINIIHVMSHLKERHKFSDLSYLQKAKFDNIIKYFPDATKSLISSYGLTLPKEFYYDFARVGGALFGHWHINNIPLQGVFNVITKVIYTSNLHNNYSGYGYGAYVDTPSNLAIISVGYSIGVNFSLIQSPQVYVPRLKKKYPICSYSMEYSIINFGEDIPILGEIIHFISSMNPLQDFALNSGKTLNEVIMLSVSRHS